MGSKGIEMGLVLVLVAMLWSGATAQSSACTRVLTSLSPCLNYITGNSSTPSSSCCSQLANVVQSQPQCLCSALTAGAGAAASLGINRTLALALPGACNVQTPPLSQCNAAGGPSTPPVGSPTSSPADSSSETHETQNIPSGFKTVPTTNGNSSDAAGIIKSPPLHFIVFLLFVVSFASTGTGF